MKKAVFGLLILALSASPAWPAGLKLTIRDGMVTLDAQDVTIRQILTEWARIGKTRVINLEGVTSGPITLKLDNVPEQTALDIILRSVPGYVAAPRATYIADASRYDRILIMATTTAVAVRPAQPPGPAFQGTQLRSSPPLLTPGAVPEPLSPALDSAADQLDDPALAAAAAAGLIPVPATTPGPTALIPGLTGMPGATISRQPAQQPSPSPSPSTTAAPSNPWNVPAGTAMPSLAPPPPPPSANPPLAPLRPPVPDR